jgi:broad specificity phosphatase PhoE
MIHLSKFLLVSSLIFVLYACTSHETEKVETKKEDVEVIEKSKATTLILVRHAEKNNDTDTSTLTPNGMKQASKLASILKNTEINSIYATPFPRMRMTAIPTAMSKNLEVIEYEPEKIEVIDMMINENIGKTALVIGHKNTIPAILNHYLGTKYTDLEGESDIFILHIDNSNSKANSLTQLYYE